MTADQADDEAYVPPFGSDTPSLTDQEVQAFATLFPQPSAPAAPMPLEQVVATLQRLIDPSHLSDRALAAAVDDALAEAVDTLGTLGQ